LQSTDHRQLAHDGVGRRAPTRSRRTPTAVTVRAAEIPRCLRRCRPTRPLSASWPPP